MKTLSEVVLSVGRVGQVELRSWVERGWVVASQVGEAELHFSEIDIARVELICDLRHDMMVDEETMPLVLSLLDQVYALRRQMNVLTGPIQQQPEAVRRAILDQLKPRD